MRVRRDPALAIVQASGSNSTGSSRGLEKMPVDALKSASTTLVEAFEVRRIKK